MKTRFLIQGSTESTEAASSTPLLKAVRDLMETEDVTLTIQAYPAPLAGSDMSAADAWALEMLLSRNGLPETLRTLALLESEAAS